MVIVRITRNRQITILATISRPLGIGEGGLVDVSVNGETIIVNKVKK